MRTAARSRPPSPTLEAVEDFLLRLCIAGPGADEGGRPLALRREDRKKARELTGLLAVVARLRPRRLVDAAAGHAYVGLCGAELLGAAWWSR